MAETQLGTHLAQDQATTSASTPTRIDAYLGTSPRAAKTAKALTLQGPRQKLETGAASNERDSYAVTAFADIIDRSVHASVARFTMGLRRHHSLRPISTAPAAQTSSSSLATTLTRAPARPMSSACARIDPAVSSIRINTETPVKRIAVPIIPMIGS